MYEVEIERFCDPVSRFVALVDKTLERRVTVQMD